MGTRRPPDRCDAEQRYADAAAAYAAALDAVRLYTAHQVQELKRQLDQAEHELRKFDQ